MIPRLPHPDSTLPLLRDPYRFISRMARRCQADLFATRLLLQPAICMTGPAALQLFYDGERFQRAGAMPGPIQKTLLGVGGVQSLDDAAHRQRKHLLMSFMTPERIERLVALTGERWISCAAVWARVDSVDLYTASQELLTRALAEWIGLPLPDDEVRRRTRDLAALFDGAGAIGPRHFRARRARQRSERWLSALVERQRTGAAGAGADTPLARIAGHREPDGDQLEPRVAAVEILNLIRPAVAISVYIVFIAHALATRPEWQDRLRQAAAPDIEAFVHEVRRFYPFFPSLAAVTRSAFAWQGYDFPAGRRVILDLYGTNHDARLWNRPDEFDPERFLGRAVGAFELVPQGGGDHHAHHRCAGEWATIALMKQAAVFLAKRLAYDVPAQDLRLDLSRLPALPRAGLQIANVRLLP